MAGFVSMSCQKDLSSPPDGTPADAKTVQAAREFFENSMMSTKGGGHNSWLEGHSGHYEKLSPGDFAPSWDRAVCTGIAGVSGVEVPIAAKNAYAAVYNTDNSSRRVEVTQKLLVNTWYDHPVWEGTYAYVATIIPTPDYYVSHKNYGRTFRHLGDKGDFSGVVIYQNIEGSIVNADRYDNGVMTARVYDQSSGAEPGVDDVAALFGDVSVMMMTLGGEGCMIHGTEAEMGCAGCSAASFCNTCHQFYNIFGECGCNTNGPTCSKCHKYLCVCPTTPPGGEPKEPEKPSEPNPPVTPPSAPIATSPAYPTATLQFTCTVPLGHLSIPGYVSRWYCADPAVSKVSSVSWSATFVSATPGIKDIYAEVYISNPGGASGYTVTYPFRANVQPYAAFPEVSYIAGESVTKPMRTRNFRLRNSFDRTVVIPAGVEVEWNLTRDGSWLNIILDPDNKAHAVVQFGGPGTYTITARMRKVENGVAVYSNWFTKQVIADPNFEHEYDLGDDLIEDGPIF